MKSLCGSVDHQLTVIFKQSGIFGPGESKHKDKKRARDLLRAKNQTASPQNIAIHTKIHSYETAGDYKDTWHSFGHFAREKMGLKDLTLTSSLHIQAYLEKRMEDRISIGTWKKEAAHLGKLQNALEAFVARKQMDRTYEDFRETINELRPLARSELAKHYKVGGYDDPIEVLNCLDSGDSHLVGRIQHEGGARLREAVRFVAAQLLGVCEDPITRKVKGRLHLKDTKGGKPRDIYVSLRTYQDLQRAIVRGNGLFMINQKTYASHLARAAQAAGESNQGTHDLRYCFAQERYVELTHAKVGLAHEQAIQQISWEMGHERASITMHYLK
jgi:hypothetical protein